MRIPARLCVSIACLAIFWSAARGDETPPATPVAPIATAPNATPSADPTAAMLQPLPEAPLQHALEDARQQIARYSGFPLGRIVPVPHAPTPDLRRVTDPAVLAEVRARCQVPERFD